MPAGVEPLGRRAGEFLGVAGLRGPQDDDFTSADRRTAHRRPGSCGGVSTAREYIPASIPFTQSACSALKGAEAGSTGHPRRRRWAARRGSRRGSWRSCELENRRGSGAVNRERSGYGEPALAAATDTAPGPQARLHRRTRGRCDPHQRHRAHLELRLEGQRIDGVAGHRVDAEVLPEQVVPVERREAATRPHPVGDDGGQHGPPAPRGDLDRVAVGDPQRRARPRDAPRRTVRGSAC